MKEFTSKVPYGWWEEFRTRAIAACGWTVEQWQNRLADRTKLSDAERTVLDGVYEKMKNEFTI